MDKLQEITEEPKTAARAAALWWAEQIGAPTFRMVDERSGPEDHRTAGIAGAMAHMIADSHPVTGSAGDKFVAALEAKLDERLARGDRWISLGVDYGPDMDLADAADVAGINYSRFPWKTHMSVTPDYVTAALGYGAWDRLIWAAPDWQHPACGSQRYIDLPDGHYEPRNEVCSKPRFHEPDHGDFVPDTKRCRACDGTYVDHYGNRDNRPGHSWDPVEPSGDPS